MCKNYNSLSFTMLTQQKFRCKECKIAGYNAIQCQMLKFGMVLVVVEVKLVTSNLPTDWTFHFGIKSPPTQAAFTEAMETVKNAWIFIGLITQWALQWVPGLGIHLIRVFHGMENFS